MKNLKNDRRSLYTRMVIKEGLLKLLADKPLNKISVTELCAASEVNRGTFYSHFYDVFNVYESIEQGFYEEIRAKLGAIKIYQFTGDFYNEILLMVYKYVDLIRVILKNISGSEFLARTINFVKEKFVKEWSENRSDIPESLLEQIFSYTANGAIGLMSEWIKSGMKQPLHEVSGLMGKINDLIINNYIRNIPDGGR